MSLELFSPVIRRWFVEKFHEPTDPQRLGWPHIAAGRNTLIAAPTGSGKTLSAFLVALDRLWRDGTEGRLADSVQVVYVSPLKALSNDIDRNLQRPLAEIHELAESMGIAPPKIRTAVRTGDTLPAERQAMLKRPPHILVTTPESLYILLTAAKSRELLRTVHTVIVDEIHALARDKRGSHLALTLERLASVCDRRPVRIGLSATQKPLDEIARFLVGGDDPNVVFAGESDRAVSVRDSSSASDRENSQSHIVVVNAGHMRDADLAIETPPSSLSAVCSNDQWTEVYERLQSLVASHRSTLIFVNTRRLAERVGHHMRQLLGEDAVAAHHGSLSRDIRLLAEQRLKSGELRAIVATASLEMGIDIGYIDLVCQIGSPRSIASLLQRVGRSGHSLGKTPKGRLFPLTRDELLESMALVRAVRSQTLDRIEIPAAPIDILAQQIVAEVAAKEWDEDKLYETFRRAWPYRELTRDGFDRAVKLVSEGFAPRLPRGAHLHRDAINGRLRARRGARLAAVTSGGAIPDTAEYRVVTDPDGTFVGKLDEDFAIESQAGDIFLLGNTSWRVKQVRSGEVVVQDAEGAPPSIPFWFGEGPGRTIELSDELSRLRSDLAGWLREGIPREEIQRRLRDECGADEHAAAQAVDYIDAQLAALGIVPTGKQIVFERFFDESGGMQLVIHAPLGSRINRAWGLALRKRFCRSFDFELQAAATDNGVLLSLSPQHSFPIESLFKMLGTHNGRPLLEQAILAQPMFQVRWRWNVTRSLAVLRQSNGKRTPPHMLRFRSDDLLAAAFPESVGCLENHSGDVEIPDHPLVQQTMHDCLTEASDVVRWLGLLDDIQNRRIELTPRDTREPSPFCHEILNANPYAFLDPAPLEERRTRAVSTRRTFTADDVRDLAKLDPAAIETVRAEVWPTVRDEDELHDALSQLTALLPEEASPWKPWFDNLARAGRAAEVTTCDGLTLWIAAERWPLFRAVYPAAVAVPEIRLPAALDVVMESAAAIVELVRGRAAVAGPMRAAQLADQFRLDESQVTAALEAIESSGAVMRGHFTSTAAMNSAPLSSPSPSPGTSSSDAIEWCDRRMLARIHRLTLDGLRRRIKPVAPEVFCRYLLRRHRMIGDVHWTGPAGIKEVIGLLEGFEAPAGSWERQLFTSRAPDYDPQWLDQVFLGGEAMWGRLRQPKYDDTSRANLLALTRVVPISVVLRDDLPWLVERRESDVRDEREVPDAKRTDSQQNGVFPHGRLRGDSLAVLETLNARGALFLQELRVQTQLLPAHLDEALRELAAWGLVTCDGFGAVRSMVARPRESRRRPRRANSPGATSAPSGRWSRFPGALGPPMRAEDRVANWCRLLLNRYGVVFRDLLARESGAPRWSELAPSLRRMELRGEVRGGRFVDKVAGEQFAWESAVEQLRAENDRPAGDDWQLVFAADPLNLTGVIDSGPRVTASHRNALIVQGGRCVATLIASQIEFHTELPVPVQAALRRALLTGKKDPSLRHPRHQALFGEAIK